MRSCMGLLFAALAFGQPTRVAFVYSDGNIPGTVQAYKALLEERPDLRGKISLTFLTESVFDEAKASELASADVLVLDTMNQQMLDRFNAAHKIDLIGSVQRRGKVFAVGEGLLPKEHYIELGTVWNEKARAFWANSGSANQLGLMKLVLGEAGVRGLSVPDPQPALDFGYYYPDGKSGHLFGTWSEFDAWRAAHGKHKPGAPRVAIGFYKSSYYTNDTALLDAIVAEVERQGGEAIPVFGYPEALGFEKTLLDEAGRARADVGLALTFRFADFQAWQTLAKIDIPMINLVGLYGRTEREWRTSNTGLSMFEGTFQVAVPELGGLVAPTVVGSKGKVERPGYRVDNCSYHADRRSDSTCSEPRAEVRGAALQGERAKAYRADLLQLPAQQGQHQGRG